MVEDEEDTLNVSFIRIGDTPTGEDTLLQQFKCFWETHFGGSISDAKGAMSSRITHSQSIRGAGVSALPSGATLETQPSLSSKQLIARAEEVRLFETKVPEGKGII